MPRKELAQFSVSHLQILDEKGRVDRELEPRLSEDELHTIYRAMVLAREADVRMLKLQRQGRIGTFGPSMGQEASSVGPAFAMTKKDWFLGAFRELGGRLYRGHALDKILHFWNGYEEGSALTAEGRTLPDSIVVGAQIPQAVGIAYAMQYRGEKDSAAVVFFGDGATSEGDFHEGLNFAAVWQAPVVFVCQNNQWAISIPREKQTRSQTIAQKAIAYEMPGIQVDGNDVLATYAATREALERAHAGGGPTLIEAVTYRMSMHTTADDPTRYRSEDAAEAWKERDPITRFKLYLENKGIWDAAREEALLEEIRAEVAAGVKKFEQESDFAPDTSFDHVFATSYPVLEEQRAAFLAQLKKEAVHA